MMFREIKVVKHDGLIGSEEYTLLSKHALRYESDILIEHNRVQVNAKSIMGVLALGLRDGDDVTVVARGIDEEEALDDITRLIHGAWKRA